MTGSFDWWSPLESLALSGVIATALLVLSRSKHARAYWEHALRALAQVRQRRFLVILLALTVGVRAAMLASFTPVYESDGQEYVEKAALIADSGSPREQETQEGRRPFYRALGYPLGLAAWYRVTGTRGLDSARWFGIAVAAATAWLVLVLGRRVAGEAAGRAAALAFACHLPLAVFSAVPYAETWAGMLLVAACLGLQALREAETSSARCLLGAATGGALGLLVVTRPEFLWMPPLFGLFLAIERRREFGRWLAPVGCVLAGTLLLLGVNHAMRDGYPGTLRLSVQGGLILFFGNNPIAVNGTGNATPDVARAAQELYAEDPSGAAARDAALAWMAAHPIEVLANVPKKLHHLWLSHDPQGFGWHARTGLPGGLHPVAGGLLRRLGWLQSLVVLVLAILTFRRRPPALRPWIWILVAHTVVWCVLAPSSRNRYPVEPLLIVAATVCLVTRSGRDAPATRCVR